MNFESDRSSTAEDPDRADWACYPVVFLHGGLWLSVRNRVHAAHQSRCHLPGWCLLTRFSIRYALIRGSSGRRF